MKKAVSITLEEDLVEWIDDIAKRSKLNRSTVIEMSIRVAYNLNKGINEELKRYLKEQLEKGRKSED